MPRPFRPVFGVIFVGYLVVAALLVLSPTPEIAISGLDRFVSVGQWFGYDLSFDEAEFGLNVLLLVPFGLLAGLSFPRIQPTVWVALVFAGSLAIEVIQLVAISGRTGTSRDVVANTGGALLGTLLLVTALVIASVGRTSSESSPSPRWSSPSPRWSSPAPRWSSPAPRWSSPTPRWSSPAPRWSSLSRPLIHNLLIAAYVVYLAAVVYLVWAPDPSVPGRTVLRVVDLAGAFGVTITTSVAERGLNILMLVPLSLLGGLLVRRFSTADWVVIGFLLSCCVEFVQRLVLPTRSGSARDIVANTLGALIGAVILASIVALLDQRAMTAERRVAGTVPADAGTMQG